MYIIINRTDNSSKTHEGSWPLDYLEGLLNNGEDVIVMSLYSNTIKVPSKVIENGIVEWNWKDYYMPIKTDKL